MRPPTHLSRFINCSDDPEEEVSPQIHRRRAFNEVDYSDKPLYDLTEEETWGSSEKEEEMETESSEELEDIDAMDDPDFNYLLQHYRKKEKEQERIFRKGKQVVIQAEPFMPRMHLEARFDRTERLGTDFHSWCPGAFFVVAWVGPCPKFFKEVPVPRSCTDHWGSQVMFPLETQLEFCHLFIELVCVNPAAADPGSSSGQAVVGRARVPLHGKTESMGYQWHAVKLELVRPPPGHGIAGTIELALIVKRSYFWY